MLFDSLSQNVSTAEEFCLNNGVLYKMLIFPIPYKKNVKSRCSVSMATNLSLHFLYPPSWYLICSISFYYFLFHSLVYKTAICSWQS